MHYDLKRDSGRGTCAAIISLGGQYFALTNAHVAYDKLSHNDVGSEEEQHEINANIDLFNKYNSYAHYVRQEDGDLDYAFIRCAESFKQSSLNGNYTIFDIQNKKLRFLSSKYYNDLWCEINDSPVGLKVYKRGITTSFTEGIITNFDNSKKAFVVQGVNGIPFSDSGDSGSLVFILNEDTQQLIPFGLVYSGDGDHSYVLSLWRTLRNFCKKNHLPSVQLKFVNPLCAHDFEFMPDV
eukprot:CAMPEP_0170062294 /NCGR_PEP_ID=MMETSP0019_2-20121128/3570_1 /TAXON_ID=98059 /ORGANISM="Dinobryon sp., Strain UTEXLB2267" /LENGTH=237 /DNA_ID=CAMNT_0010268397 /DNA_START=1044 /DNA_END=1757 /DNA_ORIENTATION=+